MTGPQWETVLNEVLPEVDGVIIWGDGIGPHEDGGPDGWWERTVIFIETM